MGMESFYVNLSFGKDEKELIKKEIETKIVYKNGLTFSDLSDNEISIMGSTFSFLPACCLIYKLCCNISKIQVEFTLETYGEEKVFDFENKAQFINFMYSKWETKLDEVTEQFGAFLIKPQNAYKSLRKLRKKYYTKF